jgi:hypothetical protein
VSFVPVGGWAVSGGIAYGVTRGLGETARARLEAGRDLIEGSRLEAVKPAVEKALARLPWRTS